MKDKTNTRNYRFTDAKLILRTKIKIAFMRRDAAVFENYGITETQMASLESDIDAFMNLETDEEIKDKQTKITQVKKAKTDALIEAINTIMCMVQLRFKKKSRHYFHFGTHDITHQKEGQLYFTALLVVKKAVIHLPELAVYGLTTAHLDAVTTLNNDYMELIIDQRTAAVDRQIYRKNRIAMGNAIYKMLMRYAAVGLSHWATRSPARHNDYIVYTSASKKLLA